MGSGRSGVRANVSARFEGRLTSIAVVVLEIALVEDGRVVSKAEPLGLEIESRKSGALNAFCHFRTVLTCWNV